MTDRVPGPWRIIPEKLLHGQHVAGRAPEIRGGKGEGVLIAKLNRFSAKPQCARAEANARLIAAAPEMLDALRSALEALTDGETSEPHAYVPAILAARAAIAKAEGATGG